MSTTWPDTVAIEADFRRELAQLSERSEPALLPTAIATAVTRVLNVDGASVSCAYQGFRVPLGASDDVSALAERLQFTTGEGPCMSAIDAGVLIVASSALLQQRWPTLAHSWREHTVFRSVISQPLLLEGPFNAALNLFFRAGSSNGRINPAALAAVAFAAAEALRPVTRGGSVPASAAALRRQSVWVAVGIVMSAQQLTGPDALDSLRGHAFGAGGTIDDAAARLIDDPTIASRADW